MQSPAKTNSILRYPMFWLLSLGGSFFAAVTVIAIVEPIALKWNADLWMRITDPGFYRTNLQLRIDYPRNRDSSQFSFKARTPTEWHWSRPMAVKFPLAQAKWYDGAERKFELAEIDLQNQVFLQDEESLPLTRENLARAAGVNRDQADKELEVHLFLDYLQAAGSGSLPAPRSAPYFWSYPLLQVELMHEVSGGWSPLAVAPLMAFWMGVILVVTLCPKPWRDFDG